ncbi:MAG TPA: hypothetical protein VMU24_03610, partial [Candidatus Acidoferrales bacterium]|nr:hypothetical protein [Candidatus Acidoferrales bacterium]
GEHGEMHHNPAKNVLWVAMPAEEIASRTGRDRAEVEALIDSARVKMEKARERRPIPYIDKTLYTNWNALCITAYLQAARALGTQSQWASRMQISEKFALKSLERLWDSAWDENAGLSHVIGYSHEQASGERLPGLLDDYAYTVLALLEAYETTSEMSHFERARQVASQMIARFYDTTGDGFFDVQPGTGTIGAVAANRKPFQDAPTPAGNSAAAIALLKLHALTNYNEYYEHAKETLEVFAGAAEQFGIYAGTYGIASVWLAKGHVQVVVVGNGAEADSLYNAAVRPFVLNKIVLRITAGQLDSLPPALAETVPNLPNVTAGVCAVMCSDFACKPPVHDPEELQRVMRAALR